MTTDGLPGFDPREVLDALGQALIVTDAAGVVVYWNAAAESLYGWAADEALGTKIDELTVPAVAQEVAGEIMRALRDGVPWSGGFPTRRKDGTTIPALVTNTGVYHDGTLVAVVGISTNLGAALHPLLERSTDAALVLRSDAVITYASPAVAQLFGWVDPVVGTSIVPLLHPDERSALAEFMAEVVSQPGAHPALEVRVLSEEGWIWTEAAVTNLLDDPSVRGVVCNLRRSTRREAQESAERTVQQLTTALKSRVIIEQAKGFLSARHGGTPDDGFARMRDYSRNHHEPIREVARRIIEGELDLPV